MEKNPFEVWLALYGAGVVTDRPWWRTPHRDGFSDMFGGLFGFGSALSTLDPDQRIRCDGLRLQRWRAPARPPGTLGASLGGEPKGWVFIDRDDAGKPVAKRPTHMPETGWPPTDEGLLDALAWLDEHRPRPVPPPMGGQVWVWPDGTQNTVAKVFSTGATLFADGQFYPAHDWPLAGAILVSGPSPWGRDVPWAPVGWKRAR